MWIVVGALLPDFCAHLYFILYVNINFVFQTFAAWGRKAKIIGYKIVYKKGYDIDKSRNLTKSFSIE